MSFSTQLQNTGRVELPPCMLQQFFPEEYAIECKKKCCKKYKKKGKNCKKCPKVEPVLTEELLS